MVSNLREGRLAGIWLRRVPSEPKLIALAYAIEQLLDARTLPRRLRAPCIGDAPLVRAGRIRRPSSFHIGCRRAVGLARQTDRA
jgi:hypothetical protein